MTTYLLDTNVCIALINGTQADVRRRFQRAVARDSMMLVSSIVAFELWCGVAKSRRKDANTQRLEAFLVADCAESCWAWFFLVVEFDKSGQHDDSQPWAEGR